MEAKRFEPQGLSIVGHGRDESVSITPVSEQGADFYEMSRVELVCFNLGESATPGAKKFLKNLPHLPHLPQVPRSKLSGKRSSFGVCGSLAILNLPRICRTCRICPPLGRFGIFGEQPEALKHSAAAS